MIFKNKKKVSVEENNNQEPNIYGNFMKKDSSENSNVGTKDDMSNNQFDKSSDMNKTTDTNNGQNESSDHYVYKEKEYNNDYLEKHTSVTSASAFSRVLLFGFYILIIVLGAGAILMIRSNKYEFYLKSDTVFINSGSSYQIELIPKDPRYFDYLNYNYTIADESVATVDEYGTVTSVGSGETTLKISLSPGFTSKTMKIISEDLDVYNVNLEVVQGDSVVDLSSVDMKANQSITIKPIVNDRDDINVTATYSSSDTSVAIVDSFGNITAKKKGKAVITGEVNGVTGTITINVQGTSTVPSATTKPGSSNPTERPSNPTTKPGVSNPTQKPSNPTAKPVVATPAPTAKPTIKSIYMSSSNMSVKKGSTAQLTAIITPNELANSTLTWKSSNTSVATVSKTGLVTGVAVGDATITATTSNGLEAKCNVKVTTDEIKMTGITLNKSSISINTNEKFQLIATIVPSGATVRKLVWSSDNEKAVTVDQTGLVIGKAAGSATIMVTSSDGKAIAKCAVTVKAAPTAKPTAKPTAAPTQAPKATNKPTTAPTQGAKATSKPTTKPSATSAPKVTSVSLGIANQTSKYVGEQLQLSVTVLPATVTNYTVEWSVDKTSVATIDKNGLLKCVGVGTVTITAKVNGVEGKATVVVKAKPTATTAPTAKPTAKPESTFNGKYVKFSTQSITVNKGATAKFKVSLYNAAGVFSIKSSKTSIAKVELENGTIWLDGLSEDSGKPYWAEKEVTITGVAAGNTTIVITDSDAGIGTYDEVPIEIKGKHVINVIVK